MAYNANIPQPADKLKDSQPQLLANFQAISTAFGVNHVNFNDPNGDQGKHKFLQMPQQNVDPATGNSEGAFYCKQGAYSGEAELVYRREGNGDVIPFSEGRLNATAGWSLLASGILIKWESFIIPSENNTSANYTLIWSTGGTIRPFSAAPFNVQYTVQVNGTGQSANVWLSINNNNTNTTQLGMHVETTNGQGGWSQFILNVLAFGV